METKHTPGPWHIEPGEYRDMSGARKFKICSSGLIAEASSWWVDVRTAEANARLIAAAPDLLAALEWLVKECEHQISRGNMALATLKPALATIARAKGAALPKEGDA